MNVAYFIASRISRKSSRSFSKLIIRIAIIGIMLSLAVMILSVSIIKGFKTEIKDKVRGYLGDVRVYTENYNNSFESTPFYPNQNTEDLLKNSKSIAWSQVYATKPGIISVNDEVEGINFKGVDSTYRWDFINKYLLEGTTLNFNSSSNENQILLSKFTANRLKLGVGDQFVMYFVQNPPRPRKFTVVGIYEVGIEAIDKGFALGSIEVIRRINNWDDKEVGGIEIRLKDFETLRQSTEQIGEDMPQNLHVESIDDYYPGIFTWLDMLDINTQVLLLLMLLVGIINMITALLIMILERINMIGILKALGATNRIIMKIFLYNALYLVAIGLVLGNVLGIGLGYLQMKTGIFSLDQKSYFLKSVPVEMHLSDILWLNLATVVICMLVLIIPALLVSKISPVKSIRFK